MIALVIIGREELCTVRIQMDEMSDLGVGQETYSYSYYAQVPCLPITLERLATTAS